MSWNNLRSRWFPSEEEQAEAEERQREIDAHSAEMLRGFILNSYMPTFRAWLERKYREYQPRPDEHAQMLYQSGLRDGFQAVSDELNRLEIESNRRSEDV